MKAVRASTEREKDRKRRKSCRTSHQVSHRREGDGNCTELITV
jgi:hypothetical protein